VDTTIGNIIHADFKSGTQFKTKEECEKNKGDWGRAGLFPNEFCRIPANDFGKSCFSNFECQSGNCVTEMFRTNHLPIDKGLCAKYQTIFGCFQNLSFGFKNQGICRD
jgi:hypothetical protein